MKYLFVIYPNKNFNVKIDLPIFYLNMKKQLQKETLLWNIPYRNKDSSLCGKMCSQLYLFLLDFARHADKIA
jgi:hypothetical protein